MKLQNITLSNGFEAVIDIDENSVCKFCGKRTFIGAMSGSKFIIECGGGMKFNFHDCKNDEFRRQKENEMYRILGKILSEIRGVKSRLKNLEGR